MSMDGLQANVNLNGIKVEPIQEFKYLGLMVQEKKVTSTGKSAVGFPDNRTICLDQMVLLEEA